MVFAVSVLFLLQVIANVDCGISNRTELELLELQNRNLLGAAGGGLVSALATTLDVSVLQVLNIRHPWANAQLDPNDCQTYTVTIRYRCLNNGFDTAEDLVNFERACNDLIPQGLKKHYERDDVEIEGKTYKLRIEAIRTDTKSQAVSIFNDCNRRGSNFVVISVQIGFCNVVVPGYEDYYDLLFMDTIAHEFGHEIVFAGEGIMESLTHKGSSTVLQEPKSDGPTADCSDDELEIMHYYRRINGTEYNIGVLPNCHKKDLYNINRYNKFYFALRKLAARDAMHLITNAQQEETPASCLPTDHFCGKLCAFGMSECSGDCPRCTLFAGCQPEEEEGGDGEGGGGGEGDDTCGKICLLRPSTCGGACPRCAFLTCAPALENQANVPASSSTTEAVTTAAAVTTTDDSSGTCGARCTVWNGICGGACPRCYFFRCREARTNG